MAGPPLTYVYALTFVTDCESGFVTVTATTAGACAASRATIRLGVTEMMVACRLSTETLTPGWKYVPLIVMSVLPLAGPRTGVYEPIVGAIPASLQEKREPAEIFHEILVHRWYLSERAGHAVDLLETARDYIDTVLMKKPDEVLAADDD